MEMQELLVLKMFRVPRTAFRVISEALTRNSSEKSEFSQVRVSLCCERVSLFNAMLQVRVSLLTLPFFDQIQ